MWELRVIVKNLSSHVIIELDRNPQSIRNLHYPCALQAANLDSSLSTNEWTLPKSDTQFANTETLVLLASLSAERLSTSCNIGFP